MAVITLKNNLLEKLAFSRYNFYKMLGPNFALPFYFDSYLGHFDYYRFESPIINFDKLHGHNSLTLTFDLNLKKQVNIFLSMFFNLPTKKSYWYLNTLKHHGFLLENSFFSKGFLYSFNLNKKFVTLYNNSDYFYSNKSDYVLSNILNSSYLFSDIAIDLLLPTNRFYKRSQSTFFELDTFISGFNSNWHTTLNSNTIGYKLGIKFSNKICLLLIVYLNLVLF